jgi:hypothetical protein
MREARSSGRREQELNSWGCRAPGNLPGCHNGALDSERGRGCLSDGIVRFPESRSSGLSARRRQHIRILKRITYLETRSSGLSESRNPRDAGTQGMGSRSANRSDPAGKAAFQPLYRETCDDFVVGLLLRYFYGLGVIRPSGLSSNPTYQNGVSGELDMMGHLSGNPT